METISSAFAEVVSVHHGHDAEIELVDHDHATGVWSMSDLVEWTAQSTERGAPVGFRGAGHYHDEYRRGADGRWRFASVRLTRLRVDPLPGGMPTR